jgi:uncharacterized protein (TIGR04141 family)
MTTLTIYLLREDVNQADQAVAESATKLEVSDGESHYGVLYVKPRPRSTPKWARLFEELVDMERLGKVQTSAALFIVPVDGRFFALSFGQGRFIMRPDVFEERFGLLVTLNSASPDSLRSIDKRAFVDDQNSRVQKSQAAAAQSFGVEIERDLVRGIVAAPTDRSLGTRLGGADALTVSVDVRINGLVKLLKKYLAAFQSKLYLTHFPWIDHVRQLSSRRHEVNELDRQLEARLKDAWKANGQSDSCWLAMLDIVDWTKVHGFRFSHSSTQECLHDLHLPGLVSAYSGTDPTVDFLRKNYAIPIDQDYNELDRWPIYRCMHCEIELRGKCYVLSAGHWFEVDKGFTAEVNRYFDQIPRYSEELPLYRHDNEDKYNNEIVKVGSGKWCLMDKKLISVGGIHDRVELCDVYGNDTFLHVKHYGSSKVLGHLFNQGLISGELLKSHEGFIELVNGKLDSAFRLPMENKVPRDVSRYTIVFAVISESAKEGLHLPFFAKVVLKRVVSYLRGLGYGSVMLAKVECDQTHVRTIHVRPHKSRPNAMRRRGKKN